VPLVPRSGSIFDTTCECIVNTINLHGAMGKGLALEFRFRIPEMYDDYKQKCINKELKIGRYWIYDKTNRIGKKVLNFPTKIHYSHPSKLEYIIDGLDYFSRHYKTDGVRSIAFPILGARHGQLDYRDVYEIMKEYFSTLPIPIEVYINHTKCDSFTLRVKELIDSASDRVLADTLGFRESFISGLRLHIRTVQSLPELLNYPKFSVQKVQKIYDFGFQNYHTRIVI